MSRKNKTIVAIAAHPKLSPGDLLFQADGDVVEQITLVTRPYWVGYKTFPGGSWWIDFTRDDGRVYSESLGDAGVTGFAYDDRPSRLVKTRAAAEQSLVDTATWNQNEDFYNSPVYDEAY